VFDSSMSRMIPLRTWATPLTIGAFFLMSATGVLMFFEWERGLTAVVHQWFSWLFLAGAGGHIAANVRPFKNHLKSRWGKASVAVFVVVLSALASVTHTAPDALVRRLKAHGFIATSQQSVHDLSGQYGVSEHGLLAIVFLPE
jgi:hypothetical protein